jgi:hypothetical protein
VPLRSGLVAVGQIAPNANVRFGSLPLRNGQAASHHKRSYPR